MSHSVHALENEYWKAGILPETGASIAFGRVNSGGAWVDILRPTAPADYGNSSNCSSFIMMPWCNRIGGGRLNFGGKSHQLAVTQDDGTARHGDVRGRAFTVTEASATAISMTLDSRTQENINWPFAFRADVSYQLDGAAFVWELALTNLDSRPFPAGFGHHPYFVRPARAPLGKPFFAVEPMTNASNGFALDEASIGGSGVFVLTPGETRRGSCRITVA
ncbi:MAG: hypothetical protein IPK52_14185 [Chloroflexi bacterium]|nr:hypothetical protein [Chloroflexota bacterium]